MTVGTKLRNSGGILLEGVTTWVHFAGTREMSLVSASSPLASVSLLFVGAEFLVGVWILSG